MADNGDQSVLAGSTTRSTRGRCAGRCPRLRFGLRGASAATRITTSLTMISTPHVAPSAGDAFAAAASTTNSANIGKAATLSGTTNCPARSFSASRKPASASFRAAAQHPPPRLRAPSSPPRSAPVPPLCAAVARQVPRSPPAEKPHRPSSRPNGRPLCRLVPSKHLHRSRAWRMARSGHQRQEAIGVALTHQEPHKPAQQTDRGE